MTQVKTVDDRIGTEQKSWFINGDIHTKFVPKISINGKLIYISDNSTPSGIVECDTRYEARKKAQEYRDRARARLAVREV